MERENGNTEQCTIRRGNNYFFFVHRQGLKGGKWS